MTAELNFLDLFLKASIVVQLVIVILISFSIISWAIIIQRSRILTSALKEANTFEDRFWSGEDLNKLYDGLSNRREVLTGSECRCARSNYQRYDSCDEPCDES